MNIFFIPKKYPTWIILTFSCLSVCSAQSLKKKSIEYKIQAAERIDKYVEEHFSNKKLPIPAQVSDEKILRRSYLSLAGRIPTAEEVQRYLSNRHPHKRDILAQQLLGSDGYKSHMTNYFFDIFRAKDNFSNRSAAAPYQAWLRQAIEENKPWDKLTNELVTAKGSLWKNGAVGYYIRDKGMELDNLSNTMRIFTGTHMECAQCHDHPHADIDQMDFYRLAAFSSGFKQKSAKHFQEIYTKLNQNNEERSAYGLFLRYLRDNLLYSSRTGSGVGRIKLPADYQYKDGDPGELVGARTPFEKKVRVSDRKDADDGIERFAEWMVEDNKRFTSVIANRMWKRIMGTALYTPVDEYVEAKKTTHPKLLEFLTNLMIDVDYDLKEFQHILLLTKTYSHETSDKAIRAKFYNQHGRQLRRLTAEQIWDSIVTLKAGNPDKLIKRTYNTNQIIFEGKGLPEQTADMITLGESVFNSQSTKELNTYLRSLHAQLQPGELPDSTKKAAAKGLARASEIQSPAPLGHLLNEFGQSDRDVIENSTDEANVNQILSILNGHIEKLIVSDTNTHVYKGIDSSRSIEENVTHLFLAILTRQPSELEVKVFKQEVEQSGETGYRNILAALLSSREFLFIQ